MSRERPSFRAFVDTHAHIVEPLGPALGPALDLSSQLGVRRDDDPRPANGYYRCSFLRRHGARREDGGSARLSYGPRRLFLGLRAQLRPRRRRPAQVQRLLRHQDVQDVHGGQPAAAPVADHGRARAGTNANDRGRAGLPAQHDPRIRRLSRNRAFDADRAGLPRCCEPLRDIRKR